ncbi:MAG: 23S rRNA (pseudouridine(1915)-N(3))-methyltransferase RlmH [Alicyclobacillaceae bacterium]|nr:23S rRNA (pseudouridine(1915)-N(3))-methyltransferase RlmH [Alicyclobacillaceae bacterium]
MRWMVIGVGRVRERFWQEALAEYAKRLSRYVDLELVEVDDERLPDNLSAAQVRQARQAEARRVERWLRERDGLVALDAKGTMMSSEQWSQTCQALQGKGYGRLVFVVGGSAGLDDSLIQRADVCWSFGPITLPHALARVVLLEQLYRGIRIARGEPYHK